MEQLVVSDSAIRELPEYMEQALGTNVESVHVTLVFTPKKPVLIVAFGEDSPTASPTISNTTQAPGSPSGARSRAQEHLVQLLLCLVVGGIMVL